MCLFYDWNPLEFYVNIAQQNNFIGLKLYGSIKAKKRLDPKLESYKAETTNIYEFFGSEFSPWDRQRTFDESFGLRMQIDGGHSLIFNHLSMVNSGQSGLKPNLNYKV